MTIGLPAQIAMALLQLVDSQRHMAYAVTDQSEKLIRFGGHLDHYGLGELHADVEVAQQLHFVEGLLPLVETPFLIRSLEMPSGRIADVHFFADADQVWIVLLDTTAEHEEARRIQQKAYDMTLLSEREARLIEQLEAANAELVRAHAELARSREELLATHQRLQKELSDAARYVMACLPEPINEPVEVNWLFVPTMELGGDSFGYHWLDEDHFAIYLLDVCGHGIGSALLSVTANQTLRSQALPGVDFHDPGAVLGALNDVYQMESYDNLFFTIWYGVLHRPSGRLKYASAGHTAPLLIGGPRDDPGEVQELKARGPAVGMAPVARYKSETFDIESPARLYLFSDGVYEISRPDGSMLEFKTFTKILAQPPCNGDSELDALLDFARTTHGQETLEDDFSIVKLELPVAAGEK